jgi:5-methyltetrahydrofolate--homocysteine methyltransferase
MTEDLVGALAGLQEQEALNIVEEQLRAGVNPTDILEEARKAMELVGKRFSTGEYFMPELVYSGEILKRITEAVKPKLQGAFEVERIGKCIIGTVAGDIHDIGKDMVVFMLDVNGFEVYDLGIDVPAQKFVDAIQETDTEVVGLSGFLTLAFDSMKETIESIRAAGLRNHVKIMIGGGQIDDVVREYTGADAYGRDAMAAVTLARGWLEGGKE